VLELQEQCRGMLLNFLRRTSHRCPDPLAEDVEHGRRRAGGFELDRVEHGGRHRVHVLDPLKTYVGLDA
jgi:hypothetical protein